MKERRIGTRFWEGGFLLEVSQVSQAACDGCYYADGRDGDLWINECVEEHKCHLINRTDKKLVIFSKIK